MFKIDFETTEMFFLLEAIYPIDSFLSFYWFLTEESSEEEIPKQRSKSKPKKKVISKLNLLKKMKNLKKFQNQHQRKRSPMLNHLKKNLPLMKNPLKMKNLLKMNPLKKKFQNQHQRKRLFPKLNPPLMNLPLKKFQNQSQRKDL
jgi:hypothetical protein